MRHFLELLGLIVAALGSFWLMSVTAPPPPTTAQVPRHARDAFAEKTTTTLVDAEGHAHYRVYADRLEHFPDDDSTDLEHPFVTLFDEGAPTWFITAERGRASAKGEDVWLFGRVEAREPPGPDTMTLDTAEVLLRPRLQYAETDRAVAVRHPQQALDAVGMRVYLREKQVELLHNVRGRYEPPPVPSSSP